MTPTSPRHRPRNRFQQSRRADSRPPASLASFMKTTLSLALSILCAASAFAGTTVQVSFTLNTTDKNAAPITQNRSYSKYRPDGYPTSTPLPAILLMETGITGSANAEFLAKADQFG